MKTFKWLMRNYVPLSIVFTTGFILRTVHPWLMKLGPLLPDWVFRRDNGTVWTGSPADKFWLWVFTVLATALIILALYLWGKLRDGWFKLCGYRKADK